MYGIWDASKNEWVGRETYKTRLRADKAAGQLQTVSGKDHYRVFEMGSIAIWLQEQLEQYKVKHTIPV